jgi:hypothetical protein
LLQLKKEKTMIEISDVHKGNIVAW